MLWEHRGTPQGGCRAGIWGFSPFPAWHSRNSLESHPARPRGHRDKSHNPPWDTDPLIPALGSLGAAPGISLLGRAKPGFGAGFGGTAHSCFHPHSHPHSLRMFSTESLRNMTRFPIITWHTSSWSWGGTTGNGLRGALGTLPRSDPAGKGAARPGSVPGMGDGGSPTHRACSGSRPLDP